jgi:hypothetical protein
MEWPVTMLRPERGRGVTLVAALLLVLGLALVALVTAGV